MVGPVSFLSNLGWIELGQKIQAGSETFSGPSYGPGPITVHRLHQIKFKWLDLNQVGIKIRIAISVNQQIPRNYDDQQHPQFWSGKLQQLKLHSPILIIIDFTNLQNNLWFSRSFNIQWLLLNVTFHFQNSWINYNRIYRTEWFRFIELSSMNYILEVFCL